MKTTERPQIMKPKKIIHLSSGLDNGASVSTQKANLFHVIWPSFLQTRSHLPWAVVVKLQRGANFGLSSHASHNHAACWYSHIGGFLEAENNSASDLADIFPQRKHKHLNPTQGLGQTIVWIKKPPLILPKPHWLRICRPNDFAQYLQSIFLLDILSSIAFKSVFTVHKVKSVSFPFQVQKANRRVWSLGLKAWYSPL